MNHTTSRPHPWLIFLTTSLLLLMANVDMSAVNLALAPIARELRIDLVTIQWLVNAYAIGGAALVMLGGRLGDIYGDKRIFIIGTLIFILASIGVGFAVGKWSIIITRLLQGFGAALAWPLAIVMNRRAFSEQQQGLIMGLSSTVMGLSSALGPPIGGLILHFISWRWIFFINVPIGVLTLGLAIVGLENHRAANHSKPHIPSVFLLVAGLLLLMYGFNEWHVLSFWSPYIYGSLLTGLVSLLLFTYLQARINAPLIDLHLFKHKTLSACFIIRILWQVMMIASFFALSLLLQNILGFSALYASLFFLITMFCFAIIAPFSGRISDHVPGQWLIIGGLITYILSFIVGMSLAINQSIWQILSIFILIGIGTGIGFPALLSNTLRAAPAHSQGMVSGILYGCLFIGGAFGVIIAGAIISLFSSKFLLQTIGHLKLIIPTATFNKLTIAATGVRSLKKIVAPYPHVIATSYQNLLSHAFIHAFAYLMLTCIIMAIIACAFASKQGTNHASS